jgi:hypothetical protein
MLKVFFLVFEPAVAWENISKAKRGYAFIVGTYLLPMVLLVCAVEGWGLHTQGKWQPTLKRVRDFTDTTVLHYEILQAVLFILMIVIAAVVLHVSAQNFHGKRTMLQTFTTVAYGCSPLLLLHTLNYWAVMHPAVPWAIGILLTMWILYQGVPRVMAPDPTHAFGAYLSALFIVLLMSAIVRLLTAMFILGQFNFKRSALTRALGEWLGQ